VSLGAHLRAKQLFDLGRHEEALKEFSLIAAEDSEDSDAAAMVALCQLELGKKKDAIESAQRAIGICPDCAFPHYVLALVYAELKKPKLAHKAIDEAIRIDPDDADYLAIKAALFAQNGDWRKSAEWAERALEKNPDHAGGQEILAQAVSFTGDISLASEIGAKALYDNPDSPDAHSTNGFIYLRQGKHRQAADHFREALRLDPNNERAAEGMAQALRSIFPLYRWFLQAQFWIAGQRKWMQVVIFIALILIPRVLRGIARAESSFSPYLIALAIPFTAFIWFTWFGESLLNVMLRFHPFGKYLIKNHERTETYFIIGLLLHIIVGLGFLFAKNDAYPAVLGFSLIGLLIVGLSTNIESNLRLRAVLVWLFGSLFMCVAFIAVLIGAFLPNIAK
jgi:tetratricopeptide (TPR) repeat protein